MLMFSVIYNLLFLLTFIFIGRSEDIPVDGIPDNNTFHYIIYSVLVISIVWLIIRAETRSLIRTRRLLKEKELALIKIEGQRAELEYKNKSITDSLNYAQRIQEALLPSEEYFRKHFKESFIFFKPKDIVSGDFYWIGDKGNKIFIVAADCTGHGVPGALMSMIGHELLEKIINLDNIEKPSEVLDIMNKGLEKTFSREKNVGSIIRDGMDIGLCVVDKKHKKIEFSGAFFPLYIVRENRLIDIKGDKYPLGTTPEGTMYTNNMIDLFENDMIYMFSDGYVDQFGGNENKKFMYRRFRYLLMTIHRFPVNDQKSILEENIKTWMGNTAEQVDDILVMGFKPL
jgi:serine phosphatase RsbU (regulator of sigma subunit)